MLSLSNILWCVKSKSGYCCFCLQDEHPLKRFYVDQMLKVKVIGSRQVQAVKYVRFPAGLCALQLVFIEPYRSTASDIHADKLRYMALHLNTAMCTVWWTFTFVSRKSLKGSMKRFLPECTLKERLVNKSRKLHFVSYFAQKVIAHCSTSIFFAVCWKRKVCQKVKLWTTESIKLVTKFTCLCKR